MKLGVLEGLLFITGDEGVSLEEIESILEIDREQAINLLKTLEDELKNSSRGLKLIFLGNKYKLSTKEEHKIYYEKLINKTISSTLSQSALETLAIIAYNQPITVGGIDEIRGVSSRDIVRKLLYRELIEFAGKSNLPGKPMLYRTTNRFLDYFNLASVNELPKLEKEEMIDEEKDLFKSKYKEIN